jgi:hypothetical protein
LETDIEKPAHEAGFLYPVKEKDDEIDDGDSKQYKPHPVVV